MSAMGQGQAGGEGTANGQGEGQGQNGGGEDHLAGLTQQLGQQGQALEEMRSFLQSNPWAQQQEAASEEATGEIDLSWLDDPAIDQQTASARLNEVLNGAVDQRLQAATGPMQEQMTNMRRDQAARDLAAEFPEIATPEMAQKVAGPNGLASQAAAQLGMPQLAAEPAFWRLAYMAHKAAEAANGEQEGSGDPGAATLESGNGAGPGPTQADLVKAIVQSGPRGSDIFDRM